MERRFGQDEVNMARILLIIAVVLVVVGSVGFVWEGLFPPKAHSVEVTHEVPVAQLVGQ